VWPGQAANQSTEDGKYFKSGEEIFFQHAEATATMIDNGRFFEKAGL